MRILIRAIRDIRGKNKNMKEAVLVSAVRTAVGKAPKGTLRNTRPDNLGAAAIKEAVARVPNLDPLQIEDVIMGCAFPEAEQGMNVARTAMIAAGLPVETSAMTINVYVDEFDEKGRVRRKEIVFAQDEGPRVDTSPEGLAKLRAVFHVNGMVTAGNSSQMSDGAAATVVISMERANELGIKPLAR